MSRRLPPGHRRRPVVRPRCEALEGRALLAATAFDSSFGSNGFVLGTNFPAPRNATILSPALAIAGDGKLVTVEPFSSGGSAVPDPSDIELVARRYNINGTLDTTFGTAGQTIIPQSAGSNSTAPAAEGLTLLPDGSIAFIASSRVVRLTAEGQLDTTFGTDGTGEVSVGSSFGTLAAQPDGKLVVAGANGSDFAVIRLTTAGALDTSFHSTGEVDIPVNVSQPAPVSNRILVAPTGAIYLFGTSTVRSGFFYANTTSFLIGLNSDGSLNGGVGTGGIATLSLDSGNGFGPLTNFIDAGLQSNGDLIVLARGLSGAQQYPGRSFPDARVFRLLPNGTVDPSFAAIDQLNNTAGQVNDTVDAVAIGADDSITIAGEFSVPNSGSNPFVERVRSNGGLDTTFGTGGRVDVTTVNIGASNGNGPNLAVRPDGRVVLGAAQFVSNSSTITSTSTFEYQTQYYGLLAKAPTPPPPPMKRAVPNDYDGDGKSDLAAELAQFGAFAIRTGNGDTVQPFGPTGTGQAIPAPGDYDGDGRTDVAAYLPAYGVLAYRPSSGGADVVIPFGPPGPGNAIPAPGDYDGDGKTDVALYLPSVGALVVDPSDGAAPYAVSFGPAGTGQAIPAPGDYDGDGKTDLALYLPASGVFAIDPSGGGSPYAVSFGQAGMGNTIPAPGDYDGDGKADIAAYLPQFGVFAYRPSGNTGDVLTTFGPAGAGNAIPVPGDYDGDSKADIALYLPGSGAYAIDPSSGQAPYAVPFGQPGAGNTVPATAVVVSQDSAVATMSLADAATPGAASSVPVYLPDDLPGVTTARKKPKA